MSDMYGGRDRDDGNGRRGSGGARGGRGKFSRFGRGKRTTEPEEVLDYKNVDYLAKFLSPTGKILGRRRTGFSGQNQRRLAIAIKRARLVALLPYVGRGN